MATHPLRTSALSRRAYPIRIVAISTVLAAFGPAAGTPAQAGQAPPPQGPGLVVSPGAVRSGGSVTVRPQLPCPPPPGAAGATAQVGLSVAEITDAIAINLEKPVPVNPDGSWSVTFPVVGTGHHAVVASCSSSLSANPYLRYENSDVAVPTSSVGYWVAKAGDSTAVGFGDAVASFGFPIPRTTFDHTVVAVAGDPSGLGYWTAAADGEVFPSGDAGALGSAASVHLAAPIVAMAGSRSGAGYWLAAADGGVFTFGDAYFFGSGTASPDHAPVVGIARFGFHTSQSYLLARADGSVVEFSAAGSRVLNGPIPLNAPIVGIAATPSEMGYYLTAADGGVFTFGDAVYAGSLGGRALASPITGITARYDGGYWLLGADGGIFSFGGAPFFGSAVSSGRGRATAIAATPDPLAPLR